MATVCDAMRGKMSSSPVYASEAADEAWAAWPDMAADDVATLLMETADRCSEPGRVNAERAVAPVQVWLPMEAS